MNYVFVSAGSRFFAAINVTYTSGESCTLTGGGRTWTAPNTDGEWTFAVSKAGVYTVKAGERAQEVTVTAQGQCFVVNLGTTVLYDGGDKSDITGGWQLSNANYGNTISAGSSLTAVINDSSAGSQIKTKNKIPLKGAKNITAVVSAVTVTSVQGGYLRLAIFNDSGAEVANAAITADGSVSLPIGSYSTAEYYVGFSAKAGACASTTGLEYPTKFSLSRLTVE